MHRFLFVGSIVGGAAFAFTEMGNLVTLIAAATVIGLPLSAVIIFAPTAAITLAPFAVLFWAARAARMGRVASAVLSASVVAIPAVGLPYLVNESLRQQAPAFLRNDRNVPDTASKGDRPAGQRIALVTLKMPGRGITWWSSHDHGCDAVCRGLLLSDETTTVTIAVASKSEFDRLAMIPVVSYRMERRSACASIERYLPREELRNYARRPSGPSSRELMLRKVAAGHCLVRGSETMGRPSVLVAAGTVQPGSSGRSFNLFGRRPRVEATIAWRDVGDGWVEPYRRTKVSLPTLFPVLAPIPGSRLGDVSQNAGWAASRETLGARLGHSTTEAWYTPLKQLGFDILP